MYMNECISICIFIFGYIYRVIYLHIYAILGQREEKKLFDYLVISC